jgi:hypothetical protein
VHASAIPLDTTFPDWGDSRYLSAVRVNLFETVSSSI